MWRYLLVLWLTTTILAGSSLCCCTLANLGFASLSVVGESCCCQSSDDASEGCPHQGGKHECPCRKSQVSSALAETERVVLPAPISAAAWQFSLAEVVATLRMAEVPADHSGQLRSSAFPYLDGRGILRMVNSLRC